MAKKQEKTETGLSFERYKHILSAANLYHSKESKNYVVGALRALNNDIKGVDGDTDGFAIAASASDESIKAALTIYGEKFNNKTKSFTPREFANKFYLDVLDELSYEDQEKILSKLDKYNQNIDEIEEEREYWNEVKRSLSKKSKYTDEDRKEAKQKLEEYKDLDEIFKFLENYKIEEMRPEAVKQTKSLGLEALVKKYS